MHDGANRFGELRRGAMSLEDQVALVTGASRGIGQAIAARLASEGAFVVGTATSEEGARAISQSLSWFGPAGAGKPAGAGGAGKPTGVGESGGGGMVLDVADSSSVSALFEALAEQDRMPGILVNNAGITRDNLLARMSEEDWCAVVDTNLTSVYRTCRACARHMMKNRAGRIVNVTSVSGATGNAGQANYAAAKAGIVGFTRSLARELAPRNITVNAVAPGLINTDMSRALSDVQRESFIGQVPIGRIGEPSDIAAAVAFLVSSEAKYITGQTLHVNGGMFMG